MRKIILFIAVSLDGYIAKADGGLDWLFSDRDYGYTPFLESIDTTLMGYETYEKVLGFGEFPYPDKVNYVFSINHKGEKSPYVEFIGGDIASFAKGLREMPGKDIWLVGGGKINTVMLNAGLIDEMIISVHPVVLGSGIPLFANNPKERNFVLEDSESFSSGLVQLKYRAG